MRKIVIILAVVIFILSPTACNNVDTEKGSINMITEARLTDREKLFLSIGSNKYFVYDYSAGNKYKWVKIWVDRYEHGNKTQESGYLLADLSEGKDGMIIAAVRDKGIKMNDWILAVNSGGALSKAESENVFISHVLQYFENKHI